MQELRSPSGYRKKGLALGNVQYLPNNHMNATPKRLRLFGTLVAALLCARYVDR